jgi:hypothetical protein
MLALKSISFATAKPSKKNDARQRLSSTKSMPDRRHHRQHVGARHQEAGRELSGLLHHPFAQIAGLAMCISRSRKDIADASVAVKVIPLEGKARQGKNWREC